MAGVGGGGGGGGGAGGERDEGQPDAVLLAPLTEDSFLHNLRVRYSQDIIYTYVGSEVVSVNPGRALPLYSAELVRAYLARPPYTLPPHVYAAAAQAIRAARDQRSDQCLVMTGESGAGKTEAARVCLQCCVLAGAGAAAAGAGAALTAAGTLLEAFGNAATARNHNASRFGKLLDVEFDFRGEPVGGHVTHFLLEKGRAAGAGVSAATGERNFHVMYQLLAGADVPLLKRLKLQRSWQAYRVLAGAGAGAGAGPVAGGAASPRRAPPAAVDTEHFSFTKAAMSTVGLCAAERGGVLRVLAFLLKVGNVGFEPHHNIDGSLGARLTHAHELEEACSLVGVCARALAAALGAALATAPPAPAPAAGPAAGCLSPPDSSVTEDEDESESLSATSSEEGEGGGGGEWGEADVAAWARARRDRLLGAAYGRLFTWLVGAANARLRPAGGERAARGSLGILDVYGLEALAHNGLERLLVNYAAERVQAGVWRAARRLQDEYARERLPYEPLALPAAPTAAELLDAGPDSLLALIEAAPRASGGARLVQRLARRSHPRLAPLPPHHFRVVHFGGPVVYCARGMVAKNRDTVCRRAAAALAGASEPLLAALFPRAPPAESPRRAAPGGLAARQRALLGALQRRLAVSGGGRVVRCLRADAALRPHRFDAALVRHQLRSQGIVEMALVRRAGWCEALCARSLLARYGLLLPAPARAALAAAGCSPAGAVAAARALLRSLPIPSAEFAFGRTKVFVRSPRTVWELEALRAARVSALVGAAQRAWRRHRARAQRAARHRAQAVIARAWRAHRARRRVQALGGAAGEGARAWAARVLWRAWSTRARRRYLRALAARLPARHASPACAAWPAAPQPALTARTDALLRRLHHRWRCARYRAAFDQTARNRMREKVTASVLFRDRKATYARSVAHPFVGDYVRLRASAAWRRGPGAAGDRYVVFADVVRKVARGGGAAGVRAGRVLAALSTHALLLLDARSLRVKRRVPAAAVWRLSLSPLHDDLLVVHVRASGAGLESSTEELSQCSSRDAADAAGCLFGEWRRRGDVVLRATHVLELATKLFLVVQNAVGAPPHVHISPQFECSLGGAPVTVCVHEAGGVGGAGGGGGGGRLVRRGSRLDVLL